MSNYDAVGLYPHNIKIYEKIKKARKAEQRIYSIIQATGTGKTYNALQLSYDEKQKNIIMIVPNLSIKEHIENTIEKNKNLSSLFLWSKRKSRRRKFYFRRTLNLTKCRKI